MNVNLNYLRNAKKLKNPMLQIQVDGLNDVKCLHHQQKTALPCRASSRLFNASTIIPVPYKTQGVGGGGGERALTIIP